MELGKALKERQVFYLNHWDLRMYALPGQEPSIYEKDPGQDAAIMGKLSVGQVSSAAIARLMGEEVGLDHSGKFPGQLIGRGFKYDGPEARIAFAHEIGSVPEERTRISLISEGLKDDSVKAAVIAEQKVGTVGEEARPSLIAQGLKHPSSKVRFAAAVNVRIAPKESRPDLSKIVVSQIKVGLREGDEEVQIDSARMTFAAPEETKKDIIKLELKHKNLGVQEVGSEMIDNAPMDARPELRAIVEANIRQAIEREKDTETLLRYLKMVRAVSKNSKGALLKLVFERDETEVQLAASEMIGQASEKEIPDLRAIVESKIRQKLAKRDDRVGEIFSARMTPAAPVASIPSLIELEYQHPNPDVQKVGAENISAAPDDLRPLLTRQALEHPNPEVQYAGATRIHWNPMRERPGLFDLMVAKGLGEKFIESQSPEGGKVQSAVDPEAFLAWQKAFEAHDDWRSAGFDYVPVRPIHSYKLNKEGQVDVSGAALGLTLQEWLSRTDKFVPELEAQKKKILAEFAKLNSNSHIQPGNLRLCFFRDEQGEIDFNRVPRLYMTDFEQAGTAEKHSNTLH